MALQLDRALRIRQPVFRDLAQRLDDVGDLVGQPGRASRRLARLHVGGERLAALLDEAGDVVGERLDVEAADLDRVLA